MPAMAAGLAACGTAGGTGEFRPPPAEVVAAHDCRLSPAVLMEGAEPTPLPGPEAGSVPAGFAPVAAVRCSASLETVEDAEGRWSAVREDRLTGDFDSLITALSQSSDEAGKNQLCTADLELVPELWLLDGQGRAIRAAWPRDACLKTKPGVHEALAGLAVTDSAVHRLGLLEPRAALEADCPSRWKLPVEGSTLLLPAPDAPFAPGTGEGAVPGLNAEASGGALPEADEAAEIRACSYDAVAEEGSGSEGAAAGESGPFKVVKWVSGTFAGAATLTGGNKTLVLEAAKAAEPAGECDAAPSRFAVLWPLLDGRAAGAALTVELDGCRRIFDLAGTSRNLSAEAHAAVVSSTR
ncbi:hypothetical protein D477_018751 [Arthrobacter crystallopoietes BAB-32]|uniref:Uncharacterized protein n=1 Tax=Arthrobacter crystallopoietes BAB-32 TaxID=1246476 RepID=N1UQN2_9MICC|nr:hypothetical protein [Arthrobacter crystallopoietes]EMY32701.1 hypothetical protein D477_018751 [Arthrobacter crystallopoietes BAB-32]